MTDGETILRAGEVTVTVWPAYGARVGQISVGGQPLLVDVPDVPDRHPLTWGSYPMAPWAGRIRHGRFRFDETEHPVPINHRDGAGGPGREHAIHGLVFERPWPEPTSVTDASWTGRCPLDWSLGGEVVQHIAVTPDRVTMTLTVKSTGATFPAVVGWHPWFRKPDRLEFRPTAMYERDEFGLPTGALEPPSPGPWDDCFLAEGPVGLHYGRPVAGDVSVDSDCDHWVVYDHPADATCVEPQSGPPDAFNLARHVEPDLVTVTTPLTRSMTISW